MLTAIVEAIVALAIECIREAVGSLPDETIAEFKRAFSERVHAMLLGVADAPARMADRIGPMIADAKANFVAGIERSAAPDAPTDRPPPPDEEPPTQPRPKT